MGMVIGSTMATMPVVGGFGVAIVSTDAYRLGGLIAGAALLGIKVGQICHTFFPATLRHSLPILGLVIKELAGTTGITPGKFTRSVSRGFCCGKFATTGKAHRTTWPLLRSWGSVGVLTRRPLHRVCVRPTAFLLGSQP
jgi:hypothetical protein